MTRTLLVGTRASTLARTQAGTVRDALRAQDATESIDGAELHFVHTPGDASQKAQTPVNRIGVGVFTETLRNALAAGECDVAVHSFKDLPTAPDDRFISVVPQRVNPRDVLVSLNDASLRELPEGAKIGTGAPRRVSQVRALRPDLEIVPIRGNIDTRMGRVRGGEEDLAAVVLAHAGLDRVGQLDRASEVIAVDDMVPAPAQGALCVEVRADDADAIDAVLTLDDPESHARAVAERSVLAELQAGCTAPVGAYSEFVDGTLTLRGGVFGMDGVRQLVRDASVSVADLDPHAEGEWPTIRAAAEKLGRDVGRQLIDGGAADIINDIVGSR
ncbi:MAG TPA: hydroxymethylbilane synthase [Candidatus Corynebacterium avicola]|uniref:Hydroxymethylbilane synthase n=1 Tax=Candidatus Corynebacterium avicola TaxID=2838527 RepID=A0A9D1RNM1_9CORY|nr:hydroxymethylbilane synthase [Candidatus Corynebacterium avicola]